MTKIFSNELKQPDQKQIISSVEEYVKSIQAGIQSEFEQMTEDEKSRLEARIMAKLRSGKKLTNEEAEYLKATNPAMYQQYLRIQALADSLKHQIRAARSKEAVDTAVMCAVSGVSQNDPYKEYVVAALNEASREFKSTISYQKLPKTENEAAKKKRNPRPIDQEEESDSSTNWSPLFEVIEELPKFDVMA